MSKIGKPKTSKGLAVLCARVAEDKLSEDIVIMDLSKIESAPCDFFVLCSCDSDVQVRAVANAIEQHCIGLGIKKPRQEGSDTANWMLLDFFDVVMHIMLKRTRQFYKIEKLWGDAEFLVHSGSGRTRKLVDYDINKESII